MEQIFIEGLKVFGRHGVYEHEKQEGQTFIVHCVMDVSFQQAAKSDCLAETVDYGNVCLFIKKFFMEQTFDLLESVAENLSAEMMYTFPQICRLQLKIEKPNAPIPMEFSTVGVAIEKKWAKAAIAIGSNIEPKERYVTGALEELISNPAIRNVVVSDYIETEPYGYTQQDTFLNGAATLETMLSPRELLTVLQEIENKAGRKREIHWGPRTLDLDILLYDDVIMQTKELMIPHIDMCNRAFVLTPLAQIAPAMVHPVYHKTIYDLEQRITGKRRRIEINEI